MEYKSTKILHFFKENCDNFKAPVKRQKFHFNFRLFNIDIFYRGNFDYKCKFTLRLSSKT